MDLGASGKEFKDLHIDGTANIDALVLATGTTVNELSIDGTLAGNSDDAIPTEKAVKTAVDAVTVSVSVKVGTFTRDSNLASGDQSITGVGFQPKGLIVFGGQGTTSEMSLGLTDGTTDRNARNRHHITADTWAFDTTNFLFFDQAVGINYSGNLSSFDADGFTIAWTKVGSPTGTLELNYIAFK